MAEMWFYTCEGKQMDPVTIRELKRLAGDGTLKPTDMVWKEGMPRWIRASSLRELFPDPTAALDKFFTNTKEVQTVPPIVSVTAPAGKSSPTKSASASTPSESPPHAGEQPQPKKRKSTDT